jgi:hypothetical protein
MAKVGHSTIHLKGGRVTPNPRSYGPGYSNLVFVSMVVSDVKHPYLDGRLKNCELALRHSAPSEVAGVRVAKADSEQTTATASKQREPRQFRRNAQQSSRTNAA